MKTAYKIFILLFVFLSACSPSNDEKKTNNNSEEDGKSRITKISEQRTREANRDRVIRILRYLPSPVETAQMVESVDIDFQEQLLHNRDMYSNYLINSTKALNLGIYGADMGYMKFYNRSQHINSYMFIVKTLAQELGIPDSITDKTYSEIQDNYQDKRQSLKKLAEVYSSSEQYLRTNERNQTAALLVTGGWLEGMYIACELAAIKPDDKLMHRIAEQKYTLVQMIKMLESVESNRTVEGILPNLRLLRMKFRTVEFGYVQDDLTIDSTAYHTFWNNHKDWKFNETDFNTIRTTIKKLREFATE